MEHHRSTLQAIDVLQENPIFLNAVCRTLEGALLSDYERGFYVKSLQRWQDSQRVRETIQRLRTNTTVEERDARCKEWRFALACVFLALLTTGYLLAVMVVKMSKESK